MDDLLRCLSPSGLRFLVRKGAITKVGELVQQISLTPEELEEFSLNEPRVLRHLFRSGVLASSVFDSSTGPLDSSRVRIESTSWSAYQVLKDARDNYTSEAAAAAAARTATSAAAAAAVAAAATASLSASKGGANPTGQAPILYSLGLNSSPVFPLPSLTLPRLNSPPSPPGERNTLVAPPKSASPASRMAQQLFMVGGGTMSPKHSPVTSTKTSPSNTTKTP